MDYQQRLNREASANRMARGLGWFSVALGLVELACARPLARAIGMRGEEPLLRFYGVREIATGIGTLAASNPAPWIWGRVAGDAVDIATLAARLDGRRTNGTMTALAAVLGAAALDVAAAARLRDARRLSRPPMRDYSNRSGFPKPPEEMRGAARDFQRPRDMLKPEDRPPTIH
jgi:hypothetical protein